MASEGSTIAKFAIPGILGFAAAVLLMFVARSFDSGDSRDTKLDALTKSLAALTTDVAVIKAVVVDSNLAKRVGDLETEMRLVKEKLPK